MGSTLTQLRSRADVRFEVTLLLNEEEAHALVALAAYGDDDFLRFFYAHLGRTILEPHEAGLRSLFRSVGDLDHRLKQVDIARDLLAQRKLP